MLLEELDDAENEGVSVLRRSRHRRKLLAPLVPASDGERHLQIPIDELQVGGRSDSAEAGGLLNGEAYSLSLNIRH